MKVRTSLKKRTPDDKIVRRKGRLYIINKKNPKMTQRQNYSLDTLQLGEKRWSWLAILIGIID